MIYSSDNRGKIQNRGRACQIIDFSGIRYKNVTPTDIDGFFEIGNSVFVFYEYKYAGAEMPRGQKTALERVVDGLRTAHKEAVLFLCRHDIGDPAQDIKAATAIVSAVYYNGKWYKGKGLTVKQQTDMYLHFVDSLGGE